MESSKRASINSSFIGNHKKKDVSVSFIEPTTEKLEIENDIESVMDCINELMKNYSSYSQ
jgi:hypothetical protein